MEKKYILTRDDVKNNLTSTDTNKPLSANQGKVLQETKQDILSSSNPLNADYVSDGTTNKVYTATEKTKLEGIETDAQVNKIESITANRTELAIVDKSVNIPLATSSTAGLKYNSDSCIQVYVSPSGSDTTGDGSQSKPWREIQTALEKTANLGYEWVRVNCSTGTYETRIFTEFNYPNCIIYANGDITTPAMEFNQNCGKVILVGSTSTTNINVITTEEYGIILAFGCSLLKQASILNVTASHQGIRIGGETSKISAPFNWYIQSFELMSTTNITITDGTGTQGGISVYFPTARLCINELNIDNPNAVGIRLTNESQICTVNKLTCNGTPYSLGYGSVLFIGGKLVEQYESRIVVYVSPDGDDINGDGTSEKPWREIQTAIEKSDWYPTNLIYIVVNQGDYYKQVYPKSHRHTYHISLRGDTTLHNNMIVSSCLVCIDGKTTGISFNIDTTEDYGMHLYYGGSFIQRNSYLNITCAKYGVHIGGATGQGTSINGNVSSLKLNTTNITLTDSSYCYGIRANSFPLSFMKVGALTVNGYKGVALIIGATNECIVSTVTTNLTQYEVSSGGMLSINGQWVNQSGGGGNAVWGQITGDINSQSDLTTMVDEKQPKVRTNMITLPSSGWVNKSITVEVSGITSETNLIVSPTPSSHIEYVSDKIYCSSQSVNTLTFTCETVPTEDIGVNILIL